ncbi:MAG TPA: LytTR family DNA-binding domain-containing protein [Chitinophagaceae bacterium]|jgi:DNA-binding LytR/AlgR family response regulator
MSLNLRCIIIDDEPLARKVLREYIEDIDFCSLLGEAENPLRAQALMAEQPADLLFLDISMPKLSGIEFLRSSKSLPMTIMTTAFAEYALDGFELNVLDYLVKPFSFERFLKACNKAKENYILTNAWHPAPGAKADHFFVKCDGRIEKVLYDDLLFVEAMLNYVTLHTVAGKRIVYLTMKSIQEQLPADLFLRVHKSYIVNLSKVKSIEGNTIHFDNATVAISQQFYDKAIKAIVKDRMLRR